jgi:hypothetical protein
MKDGGEVNALIAAIVLAVTIGLLISGLWILSNF